MNRSKQLPKNLVLIRVMNNLIYVTKKRRLEAARKQKTFWAHLYKLPNRFFAL